MTISRVVAALIKASFSKTPSGPVAVGSGANRRARAWLGYVGQISLFPSTLSVGADSLTAVGAPQNGPGSLNDNWQLYEGPLTVEGTQTVAGVLTGPTAESGGARIVLQVYQGSSGELTFGTPVFSRPESGGSTPVSRTSTVPSTTTTDSVALLGYFIGGATVTENSPATLSAELDPLEAVSAMRAGAAGSTDIGVTLSSSHSAILAAYSITEAGGGDVTGPTLSAPTKQDTDTTATGGFTTNEANGTARMVWTRSATPPTAAQVKAGQNELGTTAGVAAPAALTITSVGAKTFAAATVATSLTWWGYVVHTDGAGNDSAVLELGPVYPGTARPVTDISVSGWSVTGAATHAAALNEDVANDSSFVTSPTLTTTPAAEVHALQKPLPAGSYTINVRADVSSGGGFIRVALLDDSNNVLGTSADQVLTASLATFALPVVTTGTATRIRTEVWN